MITEEVEIRITENVEKVIKTIRKIEPEINEVAKEASKKINKISLNKVQESLKKEIPKIKEEFSKIDFSKIGEKLKSGFSLVMNSAKNSIRGVFNELNSLGTSWLNGQSDSAKQLMANIEYIKNALGSTLAPIIEWLVNLAYEAVKLVQSMVYSVNGINIFSQLDTYKINAEVEPNIDLSKIDESMSNEINNKDFSNIGVQIGQKINEALSKINWNQIINTIKFIIDNLIGLLNNAITTINWQQVGNTMAQGINMMIMLGFEIASRINWGEVGASLAEILNSLLTTIDWEQFAQMISNGLIGVMNFLSEMLKTIDWIGVGNTILEFISAIDWNGIVSNLFFIIGQALVALCAVLGDFILIAVSNIADYFRTKFQESGGDIVLGLLNGILEALSNIAMWLYDNVIRPIVEGFCSLLGIHSPSTVFEGFGNNIVEGLCNGIQAIIGTVVDIWNNLKENISVVIENIRNIIIGILMQIKGKWDEIWEGLRTTVCNIFDSIWSTIKGIINSIVGGIETMGNAVIDGVNAIIKDLNGLHFKLPDIMGGGTIGFNIKPIGRISIPRLATGGIAIGSTIAIIGEGRYNEAIIPLGQSPQFRDMKQEIADAVNRKQNNNALQRLTIKVGDNTLFDDVIDYINEKRRRTGKAVIEVGG